MLSTVIARAAICITALTLLIACGGPAPAATPTLVSEPTLLPPTIDPAPTITPQHATDLPTASATLESTRPASSPTPNVTPTPVSWQDMPIIPVVSDTARKVYQHGLELGRNPKAFAKVGDCGGTPSWFLGAFDGPADQYRLGDYGYLQETIDRFAGSFGHESVAVRPGFNTSAIFSPLWSDPAVCRPGEGPLICEIRVTNASFAFIMMGSNDVWHPDEFEPQMRRAIEDMIERGVVPILSTKVDNVEQDNSINATIARLAQEYDVPLWNFWRAAQPLPNYGLQDDGVHLTWAGMRFDDAEAMQKGWPVRNLSALQVLDTVWRGVEGEG